MAEAAIGTASGGVAEEAVAKAAGGTASCGSCCGGDSWWQRKEGPLLGQCSTASRLQQCYRGRQYQVRSSLLDHARAL